jgi:hypothetical protein
MTSREPDRSGRLARAHKPRRGPFATKPKHPQVLQRALQALDERRRRRGAKPASTR